MKYSNEIYDELLRKHGDITPDAFFKKHTEKDYNSCPNNPEAIKTLFKGVFILEFECAFSKASKDLNLIGRVIAITKFSNENVDYIEAILSNVGKTQNYNLIEWAIDKLCVSPDFDVTSASREFFIENILKIIIDVKDLKFIKWVDERFTLPDSEIRKNINAILKGDY